MPTYIYECPSCRRRVEIKCSINDLDIVVQTCDKCTSGKGVWKMERIIAPTSFQLKGPTWYRDGYCNKGKLKDFGEGDR